MTAANGLAKPEPAVKLKVRDLTVYYGPKKAVGPVSMDIVGQHVTALRLQQLGVAQAANAITGFKNNCGSHDRPE